MWWHWRFGTAFAVVWNRQSYIVGFFIADIWYRYHRSDILKYLGIRRLLFVTFDVTKKNFGIENNSFMFGHYMQMLACCTSCGA